MQSTIKPVNNRVVPRLTTRAKKGDKMAYVPVEKIFKGSDSIYKITILAARRAVELNNGAKKLIDTNTSKFSTIALEEIAAGKVKYKIKN